MEGFARLVNLTVTGGSNNVVFTISIRYRHFLEYLNSCKLISTVVVPQSYLVVLYPGRGRKVIELPEGRLAQSVPYRKLELHVFLFSETSSPSVDPPNLSGALFRGYIGCRLKMKIYFHPELLLRYTDVSIRPPPPILLCEVVLKQALWHFFCNPFCPLSVPWFRR